MIRKVIQFSFVTRRPNVLGSLRFNSGSSTDKPPVLNHSDVPIIDFDDPEFLPSLKYQKKQNEPLSTQKQRLIYQSRKRGMLENDLLLSTFAAKYIADFSQEETDMYDKLINGVSNDWDIYYWATNNKPTPPEYDNEIMAKLKKHTLNENGEKRLGQPNL